MYKAFPCSDYYGNSVAMSDIQELYSLRHSDLGNPHLASESLIIAGNEFNLSVNLLPAYLLANKINQL
jgi:hypothetical protein